MSTIRCSAPLDGRRPRVIRSPTVSAMAEPTQDARSYYLVIHETGEKKTVWPGAPSPGIVGEAGVNLGEPSAGSVLPRGLGLPVPGRRRRLTRSHTHTHSSHGDGRQGLQLPTALPKPPTNRQRRGWVGKESHCRRAHPHLRPPSVHSPKTPACAPMAAAGATQARFWAIPVTFRNRISIPGSPRRKGGCCVAVPGLSFRHFIHSISHAQIPAGISPPSMRGEARDDQSGDEGGAGVGERPAKRQRQAGGNDTAAVASGVRCKRPAFSPFSLSPPLFFFHFFF